MRLWNRNWPRTAVPESKDAPDRFRRLRAEIAVMRKQGEPPAKDAGTFAQYRCDLCNTPHPVSGLRQCVLCGRWACESCRDDEFYTCRSCAGLIKVHTLMGKE